MTRNLSPQQVYNLARDAGLSTDQATIATAIAQAESGLDADAVGDQDRVDFTWGASYGLWQIRSLNAQRLSGGVRDDAYLSDPAFNAKSMAEISKNGTDWSPWSTYKNGKYRQYLGNQSQTTTVDGETPDDTSAGNLITQAIDAVNPFDNWQADATRIAITVAFTGVALALAVLGVKKTVGG